MELTAFRGTLSLCGPDLAKHIQRLAPGTLVECKEKILQSGNKVQSRTAADTGQRLILQ